MHMDGLAGKMETHLFFWKPTFSFWKSTFFAGNPPFCWKPALGNKLDYQTARREHLRSPNTEYLATLQQTISKRSPNNQNNFITKNFQKQTLPVVNVYVHKLIHEFEVSSYQYIFSLKIFVRSYLSLLKATPFEYSEKEIQFSLPLNVI